MIRIQTFVSIVLLGKSWLVSDIPRLSTAVRPRCFRLDEFYHHVVHLLRRYRFRRSESRVEGAVAWPLGS
jgi:hypothetical protein